MVSSNSRNPGIHPLIRAAFENANIDPSSSDHSEYFTKTSRNVPQLVGEYKSLEALSQTAPPGFVPRPYGLAVSEDGKEGGMVSERFVFGGTKDQKELGRRLAEMHKYTSPNGKFGFDVPTFCGVTEQDNTWTEGWKEFFVERRVGDMVKRIGDKEISKEWEKMRDMAIPLLLDDISPPSKPVIVHGDLWSGNVSTNKETGLPVVFDPSSCYAHNEYELGICKMFGGFNQDFFEAYHAVHPRSDKYYKERLELYELYHHLNHTLMFGGGYKSGALRLMRGLISFADSHD